MDCASFAMSALTITRKKIRTNRLLFAIARRVPIVAPSTLQSAIGTAYW